MPDRCCVPGCQSNYDKAGTYVSVFKFPKDVEKKSIWCKKIPRRNWSPSGRSVVCEKHFIQSDIIRIDEISDRDGTILKVPRKCPKLKEDAYPSIFPNCPKYLTENKPTPRTSRSEKLAKSDEIALQQFLDKDRIKSFIDFCEQLDLRVNSFNLISKPIVIKNSDHVFLINLNLLSAPTVLSSIKINNDMSLNVFFGDISVPVSHFKIILNNPDHLLRWSELENILSFIKNMQKDDLNEVLPSEKEKSVYHWKKCISPDEDMYDNKKFILEQMNLCDKSKMARRYSSELLIFAYSLYMKSSSCYSLLYDSGLLSVPSTDHLGKITSILNLDNSLQNENTKKYMSEKFNKLNDENRIVNLLIDEIYVKKSIAYKGKSISGFAENKSDTEATTVQAFMVSSIYSSYKETVALVPVNNMNADYLCCLTRKALHILDEAGFSVVSMISDNNRINRNMFQKLGHKQMLTHVCNPANNEKKLFLLFDSVHLLKSIRNNWINQLDTQKTFCCPDFDDPSKCIIPKFSHLRNIYHKEKTSIVKMGHKLSFKSLYPSSLEKQNVKFAVNIFHESNDAALQLLGKKHCIENWQDTVKFLQIIRKWWNIMNVSHLNKSLYIKCEDSKAFTAPDDKRFRFLEKFCCWLQQWKNMKQQSRCGCLSEETYFALYQTTNAIIDVIKELLVNSSKFILTSKFQTDKLEYRFSQYRQMSGGNYHVSVQQILESERKIKLKSILQLHSNSYGNISLKQFVTEFSDIKEMSKDVDLTPFNEIICNGVELAAVSDTDAEVLTYIAGYCTRNIKTNCSACIDFCVLDKELLVETCDGTLAETNYAYIDIVNRGGLKYPTENMVLLISVTYLLFQTIISEKYEKHFIHNNGKQHQLLTKITEAYLKMNDVVCFSERCCECHLPYEIIIMSVVKTFLNICLNNYVKNISLKSLERSEERKLKKFKNL